MWRVIRAVSFFVAKLLAQLSITPKGCKIQKINDKSCEKKGVVKRKKVGHGRGKSYMFPVAILKLLLRYLIYNANDSVTYHSLSLVNRGCADMARE